MSNVPPANSYEDRVLGALSKILGQKDEMSSAIQKMFTQQQVHETRTTAQFEKVEEAMSTISSRLSKLEDVADDTGHHQIQDLQSKLISERVRAGKFQDNVLKAAGSLVLIIIGAMVAWFSRKVLGV